MGRCPHHHSSPDVLSLSKYYTSPLSHTSATAIRTTQRTHNQIGVRRFSFSLLNGIRNNSSSSVDDEQQQQQQKKWKQWEQLDELSVYINNGIDEAAASYNSIQTATATATATMRITITRETLTDLSQMIQDYILQADFSSAKIILEQVQDFVENEWRGTVESREEEMSLLSWQVYVARQLSGVCHELREDDAALKLCNKVFAMERDCKRLDMLDEVFCDLNFVCGVKAEILASRGQLNQALKWQNYLVEKRLRSKLIQPSTDFNFRRLLKKSLELELATRGKIYLAMGRLEDALKDFTESLQTTSPSDIDPSILLMKARIYYMQSEYSLALIDARECLSMVNSSNSNQYMQSQAKILIDQCMKAHEHVC